MFHRSTKTIASLGYRICPEYTIGYINYISLWNQTDSKSYISVANIIYIHKKIQRTPLLFSNTFNIT